MAPQYIYDVFLSFSGFDTRNNFTSHLLAALEQHGIHTFRDDRKLNKGEYIRYELLKAIEESRISLVVLSKSYATSSWCLDELVKIMECKKALQQIVLPIFYYVEPSDVRVQKGSLAEAFSKHEECFKKGSDGRVEKWREALTEVANLSGWDVPKVANGDEAHLIRQVVEEVQKKLYLAHVHVACHQIGPESRLQKLKKKLKTERDDVRIVAIWGIGGIGLSMASSSSANTANDYPTYPTCKCGKAAPLRRSKAIPNQGRRFLGCANYEIRQKRCNYFHWVDPPTREKELEAKKVGLGRNSEDMGKMIQQLSKEKKKLKKKMMAQEAKVNLKKKLMAQEAKVNLKKKLMAQEAKANSYKMKCMMLIVACIILWLTIILFKSVTNNSNLKLYY
ncbi:disease resistance protein RPV1-like isoform X2 [Rhododendron vialii]|uniref:disease resistance protein RPV1-like isoform X2 n=1 Tax=Rhododendron vialii TaxID=182163 RepID=UPI00265FADAC|nr:disease resistance protein RPV1-like isoform X2 [Rhododendron vialii]